MLTDAEIIKKQAEKNLRLEELLGEYMSKNTELDKQYKELLIAKAEAELRALSYGRKIRAIEDEIGQYQFNSVTNLVNKIKSILMSENEETH